MHDMTVRMLGRIEIVADGEVVPICRRQLRTIVAVMALEPGAVILNDRIIEALWVGRELPSRPRHALHVYVNRLRSLHPVLAACVTTVEDGYRMECPPDSVDAVEFEGLALRGRRMLEARPHEALASLDHALSLWRGPALGDLHYDEYAASAVMRLEELRVAAQEDRCDAAIRIGNGRNPIPELLQLTRAHPLRERPVALALRAMRRAGRSPEAMKLYRDYCATIGTELGLKPSSEVERIVADLGAVPQQAMA